MLKAIVLFILLTAVNCNALILKEALDTEATSLFYEGLAANDAGDFQQAFSIWIEAAKNGDPKSQFAVATLLRKGVGVEKDLNESSKWMLKSAKGKYVEAMRVVGSGYFGGRSGFDKDLDEAALWYLEAAKVGTDYDKWFYATLLSSSEMRHKDPKSHESFKWSRSSIAYYKSKYRLAQIYAEGLAVEKNLVKSWVLLKLHNEEFFNSESYKNLNEEAKRIMREAKNLNNLKIEAQLTAQEFGQGKRVAN